MKEYIRTTHNFNNDTRKWDDKYSYYYFKRI